MREEVKYLSLSKDICIYTGPSLSIEEAKSIAPAATILPPAKRGDLILNQNGNKPKIIVLIDGAFLNTLTVSPREIISLLNSGIKVIGASSIGAIRATELEEFGMIGVGRVFEMYRDEVVIADDEVAMSMNPIDGSAFSEPLIHFRVLLENSIKNSILNKDEANYLFIEMQDLYFPKRTINTFFEIASNLLSKEKFLKLKEFTSINNYKVKHDDAIKAINKAYTILNKKHVPIERG